MERHTETSLIVLVSDLQCYTRSRSFCNKSIMLMATGTDFHYHTKLDDRHLDIVICHKSRSSMESDNDEPKQIRYLIVPNAIFSPINKQLLKYSNETV